MVEGEEFVAYTYSPKLFLELEENFELKAYCSISSQFQGRRW
jgi:hypothetical protein